VLGSVARKYAHKIPFLVKFNHNEMLTYPNIFKQSTSAPSSSASRWGLWLSARRSTSAATTRREEIKYVSEMFEEAHAYGMVTVLWCYTRNNAFKVKGADGKSTDYHASADLTGQANHLGVTIQADIIKQKLPTNNGGYAALNTGGSSYGKWDKRSTPKLAGSDETGAGGHPIDLCRYQIINNYMGRVAPHQLRRRVQGRHRPAGSRLHRRRQQASRRRMGLISGRKAFQRPMKEGAGLLQAIQDVFHGIA
jgi:class I fructose-bisphosphate aldolase